MIYALVAIVRAEAARIRPMLESVRPHIAAWTILDTGSTDSTQEIIREVLDGIPGQLVEEPFVDFGTTRSRAFALARGSADWLLASDADMIWSIDPAFAPAPAGNSRTSSGVMTWRNTAAITQIDLILTTGTNFLAGSAAYLYGII